MNPQTWSSGPFAPPPPSGPIVVPGPTFYDLRGVIGMTGAYDGHVRTTRLQQGLCSGPGNPPCYSDAQCGSGQVCWIFAPPWTHDGRFDAQLSSLANRFGASYIRDFKRGTTSRAVDRFPVSGNVQTTFTAAFQTRDHSVQGPFEFPTYTHLFGEMALDAPSQCADGLLRLEFTRNDPMLLEGLGW